MIDEVRETKLGQLASWIRTLCRYQNNFLISEGANNTTERSVVYKLFTNDYVYSISASENNDRDYLGCTVTTRKPRAGENHSRGKDLPDGRINLETWNSILNAIIRFELVGIEPLETAMPDEVARQEQFWQ